MKRTPAFRLLSLAGLGALFSASSFAQEDGYAYGGLSIGQSRAKIDEPRITASLLSGGLTTTSMSRDESDTAYKIFGGWQFNRHFALEAGYFNLGKFGFSSATTPAGTFSGQIKLQGVNLDLVVRCRSASAGRRRHASVRKVPRRAIPSAVPARSPCSTRTRASARPTTPSPTSSRAPSSV